MYKVVRRDFHNNNNLYSCIARGRAKTIYLPKTWTVAKAGGLLVFKSKLDAIIFAKEFGPISVEVWTAIVRAKQQVILPKFRLGSFLDYQLRNISLRVISKVWKNLPPKTQNLLSWPIGTLAFKEVKLREKVSA